MGVIDDKLKMLPENPGVYVMLDAEGKIIYVGKAKNLKNRVRQYFHNSVKTDKVAAMVEKIADFYYIIVPSEIDALSLENNLIKKHKPRYNILLKDDKTYPYIKVNLKEAYPSFKITRRIIKDGAKYFGPFMGGVSATAVLEIINLAYGVRPCDKTLNINRKEKPCLNYHINKCSAPCAGLITREEYAEKVKGGVEFLCGDTAEAERLLKEKMIKAAENEEFEAAQKYRDNLYALDKVKLKRITSLNKFIDADVIAYRENGIYAVVNLLIVRNGRMLGSKNFSFESVSEKSDAVLEFMSRYYASREDIPEEIILNTDIEDAEVFEKFIETEKGKDVTLIVPKMGVRRQLADMASVNAEEFLATAVDRIKHKNDMTTDACKRLKEILSLKNYPRRMECYDISHISGTDKVGSMVVFTDGEADRKEYRRFKIKTVEGSDDFACLQEVLKRRFGKMKTEPERFEKPDLMIIDGGKGQLSSVKEIFDQEGIGDIDLISLAKREEEIFTVFSKTPVVLPKSDYCLKMLQRIRDEAHRFAITYHRSLRDKRELISVLDKVEGIGKAKKSALLERFKDVGGIIKANRDEIAAVNGISGVLADRIVAVLEKEGLK